MKFSHKIQSIGCSPIRKFAPHAKAAEEAGKTVYYLNIGQPDIETPAEYFDAIQSFPSPVLEYAPSQGESSLINALRNYYEAMGVLLCPEDITVTTGGSEALQLVLSCILDEGDEVIVPEPFYPNYTAFTAMAGGRIVPFPTRAEEGFRVHDVSALSALITERTKALLLSNPGNPTGAVLTREEMGALANLAKQKGLFLIADEVYREFVFNGQDPVSFLELPGLDQELVVIDSVSKRCLLYTSRCV